MFLRLRRPFRLMLPLSATGVLLAVAIAVGAPAAPGPRILFVIDEAEYRTAETLPAFAREELEPRGFRTRFVFGDTGIAGGLAGLEQALGEADLVVLSVRRRVLPASEMAALRGYLAAGKPLLAIRTSSHAFALREGSPAATHRDWPDFDRTVLGARYLGHYENRAGTEVLLRPEAGTHPILTGIRTPSFHSAGTLYRSRELAPSTEVLLYGRATDSAGVVTEPVAWTGSYSGGRIFYTSLGHPDDFRELSFRRLLTNAVYWALGQQVPAFGRPAGAEAERYMGEFPRAAELSESGYLRPEEALKRFRVGPGVEIDLVAAEPTIFQPVEIGFDHRGRLWVVQYNQYPHPEGVSVTSYDEWLRAVFDTVPPPPPHHTRGADRITVLEDGDGDGTFETARDLFTGLNLATSVALGRGGVWVLNPPYLLKFPDPDGDGMPDGDPEVHLSGFGLEDTHAVANSLQWGPDGWLYGAQGSTTTADVSSAASKHVRFEGQGIWRYHPETAVFELFAEGGGNTFNVEFDSRGRLYSGHNGGNARAFHYKQGGYYLKNWGKHGAFTNPYAFGHLPHLEHSGDAARFTHAEVLYEADVLPARLRGKLISINPLFGRVEVSRMEPVGSTFRTIDTERLVDTDDGWYRPVDIQDGPDGAVYLSDWYDARIDHVDPRDNWHRASGRVYRLRAAGRAPGTGPFDLARETTSRLIERLAEPNRWFRQEALRLLGDRKDRSAIPTLRRLVRERTGQIALEALWALNLTGGFDEAFALATGLSHADPHVRLWTVRLLGDRRDVSAAAAARLGSMALTEPDPEVRSQLAVSAKRLPAGDALPIVSALLRRAEDQTDPEIPLQLWWAVEAIAGSAPEKVATLFQDAKLWSEPLVQRDILQRLVQRLVMEDSDASLRVAARLLRGAPRGIAEDRLMAGLLDAVRGTEMRSGMPAELEAALEEYQRRVGSTGLALGLRRGDPEAVARALTLIADPTTDRAARLTYIQILGEVHQPSAVPLLLRIARAGGPAAAPLQRAALQALTRYAEPGIGAEVASVYPVQLRADPAVRSAALELLASRPEWAAALVDLVRERRVRAAEIPAEVVEQLRAHGLAGVERLWPANAPASPRASQAEIDRLLRVLAGGEGNLPAGRVLFQSTCSGCHQLHGTGGKSGPDLTGYDREDLPGMLRHILDPSAYIREGYATYLVKTRDGRSLTGFISDRSGATLLLTPPGGGETAIPRDRIVEIRPLPISQMPEGLLTGFDSQQLRDLFAFLRSSSR